MKYIFRAKPRPLAPALTLALVLLAASLSGTAAAREDPAERRYLLRFLGELQAAEQLLGEAQRSALEAEGARRQFNYAALLADLELVQTGIEDYLRQTGTSRPRSFRPLHGDYLQVAP